MPRIIPTVVIAFLAFSHSIPVMELDLTDGARTVPVQDIQKIRFTGSDMIIIGGGQETVPLEDIKVITFDTAAVSVNPQPPVSAPVTTTIVLQIMSFKDQVFVFPNINGLPFTASIYDVYGKEIRSLYESRNPAGSHFVFWDGADGKGRSAASGTYYLVVKTGEGYESRRVIFLDLED